MYGLDEGCFVGILDNSPLKHGKRLYGCALMCRKPADVLADALRTSRHLRIFLNIGCYNDEVATQLRALNADIECITL